MVSTLAIINAKRVWRGGSALDGAGPAESSYPPDIDAVFIRDGVIDFIGTTAEVQALHAAATAEVAAHAEDAPRHVTGGRPRPWSSHLIDCEHKRAVYPGFIDAHVHFLDGGRHLLAPQLDLANSREKFVSILQAFVDHHYNHRDGGWIFGGGWSEAVLGEWPHREWLDAVSPTIPMVMYSKDVHSCVMNEAALRHCHIIPGAADGGPLITHVEGGRVERDAKGEPTGILRDNAMNTAKTYLPRTDPFADKVAALEAASDYFLSNGFTTVFSMMSTRYTDNVAEIAFLREMEAEGKLRLRVRYGVPIDAVSALAEQFWQPVATAVRDGHRHADAFTLPFRFTCTPPEQGGGYCILGTVKLFSDGSLSSQTAAMNRPYHQDVRTEGDVDSDLEDAAIAAYLRAKAGGDGADGPKCQCGLLTMSRMELRAAVRMAHSHNFQLCVHAIGDRAVATVNKVLCESSEWLSKQTKPETEASVASFQQAPRSRVEHCQHVANVGKEVSRMKAKGIIASMQPCHLLFDGDYVDALLGESRKSKSYIWGTFLRNGIRVALGSDWPVAPADVADGLRGAVTRVPDVMSALAAEQLQAQSGETPNGDEARGAAVLKRYHEVWNPSECLTMDAALRTYTYESAYGAFLEGHVGTVEVGRYADITIWSDDFLLPAAPMVSLGVAGENSRWWPKGQEPRVDFTIVAGIVEYARDGVQLPS